VKREKELEEKKRKEIDEDRRRLEDAVRREERRQEEEKRRQDERTKEDERRRQEEARRQEEERRRQEERRKEEERRKQEEDRRRELNDNKNSPTLSYNSGVPVQVIPPSEYQKQLGWCGALERTEAEDKLRGCPVGTFLIRWSNNARSYVLSYTQAGATCVHVAKIVPMTDGTIKVETGDNKNAIYKSLMDLIAHTKGKGIVSKPVQT